MPDTHDAAASPILTDPASQWFVSPHYDDIALSCGGTVALLARGGLTPQVYLVFGSEPDPVQPLSPFAIRLHRDWGLDAGRVIAERKREEAAASGILGATFVNLPFRDAIYRGPHYQSDAQLFGKVPEAEAALPEQIAAELAARPGTPAKTRIFMPLGIGNHVDHQIVFTAGVRLAAAGHEVWFYEDLPYALQPGSGDERLRRIEAGWRTAADQRFRHARLEPAARIDVSTVWDTRIDAILSYTSQVPTLFPPDGAAGARQRIDSALRDYALRAGDGILTEQMWQISGLEADLATAKK